MHQVLNNLDLDVESDLVPVLDPDLDQDPGPSQDMDLDLDLGIDLNTDLGLYRPSRRPRSGTRPRNRLISRLRPTSS